MVAFPQEVRPGIEARQECVARLVLIHGGLMTAVVTYVLQNMH